MRMTAPAATIFPPCSSADRKSTRLNSSHSQISYAVFCLKKKTKPDNRFFDPVGQIPASIWKNIIRHMQHHKLVVRHLNIHSPDDLVAIHVCALIDYIQRM